MADPLAEWSHYLASPIDLNAFIDKWLKGMRGDCLLVGINFNADLAGLELRPLELAKALTKDV